MKAVITLGATYNLVILVSVFKNQVRDLSRSFQEIKRLDDLLKPHFDQSFLVIKALVAQLHPYSLDRILCISFKHNLMRN